MIIYDNLIIDLKIIGERLKNLFFSNQVCAVERNEIKVIILIFIIIAIVLVLFIQYNILVRLKYKVKQSKSGIDVYLQQRFDLIPNLVQVVKGYMNYEGGLFESITKLRTQYNQSKSIKISEELNNKLNSIIATAESYPELKANEQFLRLQKNLAKMENQIQAARRLYNADVTNYNTKINIIPYNIIAKTCGFKEESLFQSDGQTENNISIDI